MRITNGDVMRHCTDRELAQVILYKSVGMVMQVLEAKGEHEDTLKFWALIKKYEDALIDEQAEWLGKEVNITL